MGDGAATSNTSSNGTIVKPEAAVSFIMIMVFVCFVCIYFFVYHMTTFIATMT